MENYPIRTDPVDPYEKYKVEAIQKDKSREDKYKKNAQQSQETVAFAAKLVQTFQKILDLFQKTTEKGLTPVTQKSVKENLILFRDFLNEIKWKNRSQDTEFLNLVSIQWRFLLEDALKFKRSTPYAVEYVTFIQSIDNYPEGTVHTFGYYLMEQAGQNWLPFPYIELLDKMHEDYLQKGLESSLAKWTDQIDLLIEKLEEPEK